MSWFERVYNHPRFLQIFALISVLSFGLASFGLLREFAEDGREQDDRIASDVASCMRGNVGRQSDIDMGLANEELIRGILEKVLYEGRDPAQSAALANELEPLFVVHRDVVDGIVIIDCTEAVPGAKKGD